MPGICGKIGVVVGERSVWDGSLTSRPGVLWHMSVQDAIKELFKEGIETTTSLTEELRELREGGFLQLLSSADAEEVLCSVRRGAVRLQLREILNSASSQPLPGEFLEALSGLLGGIAQYAREEVLIASGRKAASERSAARGRRKVVKQGGL